MRAAAMRRGHDAIAALHLFAEQRVEPVEHPGLRASGEVARAAAA